MNESEDDGKDPLEGLREITAECPILSDIGIAEKDLDHAEIILHALCAVEHALNYLRVYKEQFDFDPNPESARIRSNFATGRKEKENPIVCEKILRSEIALMIDDKELPGVFRDVLALILRYANHGYPLPVMSWEIIHYLKKSRTPF
jgi:hypothetical protein